MPRAPALRARRHGGTPTGTARCREIGPRRRAVAACAVRRALAPPPLARRQGARRASRRESGGRTLAVRRRRHRLHGRLPMAPPPFQLRNRRPLVRWRQDREGSPGRCPQRPLGSRTDRACPRLGTACRSVGARIVACGRLPSAAMAVETGTVVALRNLQRRWRLELRRRLSGHQRGTAVSDRCF